MGKKGMNITLLLIGLVSAIFIVNLITSYYFYKRIRSINKRLDLYSEQISHLAKNKNNKLKEEMSCPGGRCPMPTFNQPGPNNVNMVQGETSNKLREEIDVLKSDINNMEQLLS